MKFILTISICLLNLFTIHSQTITDHLFQKWIKVASNDPYNGDDISKIDTAKYKSIIQFTSNGEFLTDDNWNNEANGKWKWNEDKTKIGVVYLKYNDQIHEDKPITEYRMFIFMLTKDSLIIGQQGRHGICRDFYLPIHE